VDYLRPLPAPADTAQGRYKERSMCRWGPHASAALLLPGCHRASVEGKAPVPLRFWLSTLLLDMKHDATDRFMRDTILLCNRKKWLVVLHHTMNDHRPVFSGNAVVRVFWPWPPFANHWRRARVMCFIVSEHVLYLEIQFARRGQEEVENW